jgi:alpha-L-fucosidase
MPNGKIQPEFMDTLKVVGKWMNEFGETIYGTRQGPVTPKSWGVTTQKDNRVFIHLLNAEDRTLLVPKLGKKIVSVRLFHNKQPVIYAENKYGVIFEIPASASGMPDIVIEVTLIGDR